MSQIADRPEPVGWTSNILVSQPRSDAVRWLSNVKEELQRSFNRSSYLYVRLNHLRVANELIRSMWGIEKNWDSYGAEPPNAVSIRGASDFAQRAVMRGLFPERIEPSAEGGIAVAFFRGEKRAIAEFLNDETRELFLYARSGEMFNGIPANDSLEAILAVIRDYLSADTEASC
jgi:hypothetical protein